MIETHKFPLNKKSSKFIKLNIGSKGKSTLNFSILKLNGEEEYPYTVSLSTRNLGKWMAYVISSYPEVRTHFAKSFFGLKDQKLFTDIIEELWDLKEMKDSSVRNITKKVMVLFAEDRIKSMKNGD